MISRCDQAALEDAVAEIVGGAARLGVLPAHFAAIAAEYTRCCDFVFVTPFDGVDQGRYVKCIDGAKEFAKETGLAIELSRDDWNIVRHSVEYIIGACFDAEIAFNTSFGADDFDHDAMLTSCCSNA